MTPYPAHLVNNEKTLIFHSLQVNSVVQKIQSGKEAREVPSVYLVLTEVHMTWEKRDSSAYGWSHLEVSAGFLFCLNVYQAKEEESKLLKSTFSGSFPIY